MSENKVMQKITVIVDAWTTDSEEFDMPCSFYQVMKGFTSPDKPKDTTRYNLSFEIPVVLSENAKGKEVENIEVFKE